MRRRDIATSIQIQTREELPVLMLLLKLCHAGLAQAAPNWSASNDWLSLSLSRPLSCDTMLV